MSVFLPKSTFHQGIRHRDLRLRELGTPCSTKHLSPLDHPLKKLFIDTATGKLGSVTRNSGYLLIEVSVILALLGTLKCPASAL